MNKPFFFFLIAFASIVLYACEPAKQGGGDAAPSNFNDGTVAASHENTESKPNQATSDSTEKTIERNK